MIWDGTYWNLDVGDPGEIYEYILNDGEDKGLVVLTEDTSPPELSGVLVAEGPSLYGPHTVLFHIEDDDTFGAWVDVVAVRTEEGIPVGDKIVVASNEFVKGGQGFIRDFLVPIPGTYDVTITACDHGHNSASAVRELNVTNTSGLSGADGQVIAVAPNPSSGAVMLRASVAQGTTAEVRIVGADGRTIRKWLSVPVVDGTVEVPWDGRDQHGRALPSGTWFGRIRTEKGDESECRIVLVK